MMVRFRAFTLDQLRPWGNFFAIASIAAWTILMAMDSPYEDLAMLLLLSFTVSVEWIAWHERRRKKAS
ncbi:MAG TPA: hypothetical protein VFI45_10415 [Candidatus Acidoferrum sp.]|nr:hypothetical protein [Candidatus Acidoferrum sp.]